MAKKDAKHVSRLRQILESPEYILALKARLIAGQAPAGVETLAWHYVYGKPADTVRIEDVRGVEENLTSDEIAKQAAATAARIALAASRLDSKPLN